MNPEIPQGTPCDPCAKKGHRCYANAIVDGVAICVFCEDGEPCLYEKREAAAAGTPAPIRAHDQPKPQALSSEMIDRRLAEFHNQEERQMGRTCKGYGEPCSNPIGDNCKTGLCSRCYGRKAYDEKKGNSPRRKVRAAAPAADVSTRPRDERDLLGIVSIELTADQLDQLCSTLWARASKNQKAAAIGALLGA